MTTERDFPVDRPPQEDNWYILTDEDFEALAAEVYANLRELPEVTERDACAAAEMVWDLGTGEWLYDDPNDDE